MHVLSGRVVVQVKADLVTIEGDRPTDVADRQDHDFQGPIHAAYLRMPLACWYVSRRVRNVRRPAGGCPDRGHLDDGLMAGVFGIYSNAIMPGLRRTDDRTFVAAFQSIDRAILNPAFLATFLGALVFTALAALLHLGDDDRPVLPWIGAALVLYLLVFVITIGINVPSNNDIKAAGDVDRMTDPHGVRSDSTKPVDPLEPCANIRLYCRVRPTCLADRVGQALDGSSTTDRRPRESASARSGGASQASMATIASLALSSANAARAARRWRMARSAWLRPASRTTTELVNEGR